VALGVSGIVGGLFSAVGIVGSISLLGDAYGHVYQALPGIERRSTVRWDDRLRNPA
jgi:hypothetical protein